MVGMLGRLEKIADEVSEATGRHVFVRMDFNTDGYVIGVMANGQIYYEVVPKDALNELSDTQLTELVTKKAQEITPS